MTTNRRVRALCHPALLVAFAAVIASTPARAIWEAAEGEVFLSLDASVAADSNIASNSLEISDTIYSVTPGVSWERSRGRGTVSLSAKCEIERASEYEGYDSENYSAAFALGMPATGTGRLRGDFNASYFDGSRVNSYQNTRISETSFDLGLNGTYQVSNKVNARVGARYGNTEPETLADYTDTSLNLGLGYNFRPAVSTYLDVRFTDSSSGYSDLIGGGTDTSGHAILVGLDGQITAKLSGHIGVGYDQSESETGGVVYDYSGPTYDVALSWNPRDRTTISLNASNGIQSTSTGGTEYIKAGLTITQEIGLNMSADAGLTFRSSDFASETRGNDDVMEASIGARYAFTRNLSMRLSYTYTDSDSTSVVTNYTRSVWKLSGSARF